jgi:hypothetical protein
MLTYNFFSEVEDKDVSVVHSMWRGEVFWFSCT